VTPSSSAESFLPEQTGRLSALRAAAQGCQGCELLQMATQFVFGERSASARIMLVGEQPGDQEDRQGIPFVGPAGELLDRAPTEDLIARRCMSPPPCTVAITRHPSGPAS
jgi:uracil-DNA glycosylase